MMAGLVCMRLHVCRCASQRENSKGPESTLLRCILAHIKEREADQTGSGKAMTGDAIGNVTEGESEC